MQHLSNNTRKLLYAFECTQQMLDYMRQRGKFISLEEGFIWLFDKGDCYRLMAESVKRPWSLTFIKTLRKLQKGADKTVYIESEDESVLRLAMKAGAKRISENKAEWRK